MRALKRAGTTTSVQVRCGSDSNIEKLRKLECAFRRFATKCPWCFSLVDVWVRSGREREGCVRRTWEFEHCVCWMGSSEGGDGCPCFYLCCLYVKERSGILLWEMFSCISISVQDNMSQIRSQEEKLNWFRKLHLNISAIVVPHGGRPLVDDSTDAILQLPMACFSDHHIILL